jgi:hypothetical protein
LELLDVHGKRLAVQSGNGASAQALQRPTVRGIYFVRLLHKNGQNIQSVIVP